MRPPRGCAGPAGPTGSPPGTPEPISRRRCSTGSRPHRGVEPCSGCGPGGERSSGRCWRSVAIRCGGSPRRPACRSATTRRTPSRCTPATGCGMRSCPCCVRSGPRSRRRSPRPRRSWRRRARRSRGPRPRSSPSRVRTPPARSAGTCSHRSTPRSAASHFAASPSEPPDSRCRSGATARIRSGGWSNEPEGGVVELGGGVEAQVEGGHIRFTVGAGRRAGGGHSAGARQLPLRQLGGARGALLDRPGGGWTRPRGAGRRCARRCPGRAVLARGRSDAAARARRQQIPPGPVHRPQGPEVVAARASGGHLRWAHRLDRRRRGLRGVRREGRRSPGGRTQGSSGPYIDWAP